MNISTLTFGYPHGRIWYSGMEKVRNWSTALRLIKNEILSPKINRVFNLPITAMPMRVCKCMYEQFHLEITGNSAITNFCTNGAVY